MGEAEGAVARRDGGDTQCQGNHGPWLAGQRRGLSPTRTPRGCLGPRHQHPAQEQPKLGVLHPSFVLRSSSWVGGWLSEPPSSSLQGSASQGAAPPLQCQGTPVLWHTSPSLAAAGDSPLACSFLPRVCGKLLTVSGSWGEVTHGKWFPGDAEGITRAGP